MFAFDIDILLEEEMKPNPFYNQLHDKEVTTPNITRCQKILNHRRTTKRANKEQEDKQQDNQQDKQEDKQYYRLSPTKTMGIETRMDKMKRSRK